MLILLIVLLLFFGCLSLPVGIALGLATMLTLVLATNIDPIMAPSARWPASTALP